MTNSIGFIRDPASKAVINTDLEQFMRLKEQRNTAQRLQVLETKIYSVAEDLQDIKNILLRIVDK